MNKIIGAFLSLFLLFGVMPYGVQGSGESTDLVLVSHSDTASAGNTVSVSIRRQGTGEMTSLKLKLSYDASVLELIEAEDGKLIDGFYQGSQSLQVNPYVMVWVAASAQSCEGDLITFTFRVKEGAVLGATALDLLCSEAYNGAQSLDLTTAGTTVVVVCAHQYDTYTSVDASHHSACCSLCQESELLPHEWDDGVVTKPADVGEPGELTRTCSYCTATTVEEIPALPPEEDTGDSTGNNTGDSTGTQEGNGSGKPSAPDSPKKSNDFPIGAVLAIVGILLAGGAVATVVVLNGKKKKATSAPMAESKPSGEAPTAAAREAYSEQEKESLTDAVDSDDESQGGIQ